MADHVRGALSQGMDSNQLFEKYTIEEIREIEKKTRQNIERKKEDLRQMVGERYRDVIEAADTITDMKNIAQNVSASLARMHGLCESLHKCMPLKPAPSATAALHRAPALNRKSAEKPLYGLSAEMKLLMDMPEKIWSCLDSSKMLRASQLFLLARHVHTSLQLGRQRCPLLALQWAAVTHLRATILDACRKKLATGLSDSQVTAECLASILLLEDASPAQVFAQFLDARKAAVRALFSDAAGGSVKQQVCELVRILHTTMHQVYTIFNAQPDNRVTASCDLLMSTVTRVTDSGEAGEILRDPGHGSLVMNYLPATVTAFRPARKHGGGGVDGADLRKQCKQWIDGCVSAVQEGLGGSLEFITTVKGLAAIRDQLHRTLSEDELMSNWEGVCLCVLGSPFNVWTECLQPLFLARTKALLAGQLEAAFAATRQQVGRVLTDLATDAALLAERDAAGYVWAEASGDIAASMAWGGPRLAAGAAPAADRGALAMKAKAYTPAVQSLCRSFDGKLRALLEDSAHYSRPPQGDTAAAPAAPAAEQPFDQFGDRQHIDGFLQGACQDGVEGLLKHLGTQLYANKQQLVHSEDRHGNNIIIDRILLLGRLASALSELSPQLKLCTIGEETAQSARSLKKSLLGRVSRSPEDPRWSRVRTRLQEFSQEAYDVWSGQTCAFLLSQVDGALLHTSPHAILLATTKWDEILIEEETESGGTVKSTIRVPMQPSWYVQSILYGLCQELNRIGGYALRRSSLQKLVASMSDGFLAAYEKFLAGRAAAGIAYSQNHALQLLFDVRFVDGVMLRRGDTKECAAYGRRLAAVVEQLEGLVDPFDLDVFSPYIRTHLQRQTQRCQVMYGALCVGERPSATARPGGPAGGGQQEQHNVLALSSGHSRFPLLPLSVHSSRTAPAPPVLQPPKPKTSPLHSASSPPGSAPADQASFFGQMSTIWFSNVNKK